MLENIIVYLSLAIVGLVTVLVLIAWMAWRQPDDTRLERIECEDGPLDGAVFHRRNFELLEYRGHWYERMDEHTGKAKFVHVARARV